jgi:AcrR family transcriptional regulator
MSEIVSAKQARSRRRADAEHNIAAILEAAIGVLGERPDASMAEIAAAAGVARQTVYAHFESREALLDAVAERALAEAVAAIDAAEPDRGAPAEALTRLVRAWWATVSRHARGLEALAAAFPGSEDTHAFHHPILERLERLVRRGQRAGDFDRRLPVPWVAAAFLGLMHTAADSVAAGRLDDEAALRALERTVPRVFGATRASAGGGP